MKSGGPVAIVEKSSVNQNPPSHAAMSVAAQLFEGGGEMGERMLALDWSETPLGPIENWPPALKVLVPLMLKSRQAMFIIWGDENTLLYNDRYAEILLRKHPAALAQPFQEVWHEIWDPDLKDLVSRTKQGESISMDNITLQMERKGYTETTHFSFSYTPIRGTEGEVLGIFCPCDEITNQVKNEARQRFGTELMDELRASQDPVAIVGTAAKLLARHLNASQAAFVEIEPDDEHAVVTQDWTDGTLANIVGRHRLSDFGTAIFDEMRAGRIVVIPDVTDDPRVADPKIQAAFAHLKIASVLDVPFFQNGRMIGVLTVLNSTVRHWEPGEVALVEEVAERVWNQLERERAEEMERRRLEQLQTLTATSVNVTAASGLDEAMAEIIDGARRVVDVHQAVVSLTMGKDWEQAINSVYLSDKYAEFSDYDAPPTGQGIYTMVCEHNRAMRMTQAQLEAHPRFRSFSDDKAIHPPMRGWLAAPLVGRDGSNLGLVQMSDKRDGTEFDDADEAVLVQLAQLAAVAVEQARTSDALRRSENRRRLATEAAQLGIWSFDLEKNEIKCDYLCRKLFGLGRDGSTYPGEDFMECLHPEDRPRVLDAVRAAIKDTEHGDFDCEYRVIGINDGVQRWLKAKGRALFEGDRAVHFTGTVIDISDRRRTEERQTLLAREIDHRAKNLLAVVQSVVQLTRAETTRDLKTSLVGRIHALSQAHNLLAASQWEGVPLGQVLSAELAPFRETLADRIAVEGPDVQLTPAAGQSLALVLHELATNAVKYGAMSEGYGLLDIRWSVQAAGEDKGMLCLSWRESDGPPVASNRRDGFGSTMMRAMVRGQLGGTLDVEWADNGMECRICLPANQLTTGTRGDAKAEASEPARPTDGGTTKLEHVMLVEDEALIALEMAMALEDEGLKVVGPYSLVEDALNRIAKRAPDAAILDVNLGGKRSFPIADALAELSVPFAFCTGYAGIQDLPARFQKVPMLRKPVIANELRRVLREFG